MPRKPIWLFLLLAGCGGSQAAKEDFLSALPKREQIQIAFPDGSAESGSVGSQSAALIGETAQLYAATRVTSQNLNGMAGSVLATLEAITRMPPSEVGKTRVVWGPFTPVLSPVNYRLNVERVAPNQFAYRLDGRPKSDVQEEAFRPVLAGTASPESQAGAFSIDFNRLHLLDSIGTPQTGGIAFEFEITPRQGAIRIHLEGLTAPNSPPVTGDEAYVQLADGSGDFLFGAHPGLSGVSTDLQGALIRSRWNPSGAGRADAHVAGDPAGNRDITECWDENFSRVFFSVRPGSTEGDPALCVYAEPLPPL